jgi:hypothetical protein
MKSKDANARCAGWFRPWPRRRAWPHDFPHSSLSFTMGRRNGRRNSCAQWGSRRQRPAKRCILAAQKRTHTATCIFHAAPSPSRIRIDIRKSRRLGAHSLRQALARGCRREGDEGVVSEPVFGVDGHAGLLVLILMLGDARARSSDPIYSVSLIRCLLPWCR